MTGRKAPVPPGTARRVGLPLRTVPALRWTRRTPRPRPVPVTRRPGLPLTTKLGVGVPSAMWTGGVLPLRALVDADEIVRRLQLRLPGSTLGLPAL